MVETTKDVPLRQSGCLNPTLQFLDVALMSLCHTATYLRFPRAFPVRRSSISLTILKVSVCLSFVCFASQLAVAQVPRANDASQGTVSPTDNSPSQSDHVAAPVSDDAPPLTLFPHSTTSRYWISGQANLILQWHPDFP